MKNTSPQVDAYIARAAPFTQPILKKLRVLFHKACPQIEEAIKWGMPHFLHKGNVAGMAAFKAHVAFGFWKRKLMSDPHRLYTRDSQSFMNASRLTEVSQLPADAILLSYIREAVRLNVEGVKTPTAQKQPRKPLPVPPDFKKALAAHPNAQATFDAFAPSCRREYIEWITGAKQRGDARQRRIASALEWLAQGKQRNWKYK